MNVIFNSVIVLDKMCFHMLNLCWFKHKKIFECFWKVFCFYKNWKISKTVLPYFGDSVVGHPSRMLQPRDRGLVLMTCSRVKGSVTRGTQRFSRLSSLLPREWDFQSRKTLKNFFHKFDFECFGGLSWRLARRLVSVAKIACFAKMRQFCWFVVLLILWCSTLLSIYIVPFVSHTHTLSWLRPYSHEFRA